MTDTMKTYVVDAVIETNEGRKDFQELISRVEVKGKHKAIEMRNDVDFFFTRVKGRDDVSVFSYPKENAPDLAVGKVMQVK